MLSWLHFSDLHCGESGQKPLWPNVRDALFNDLKWLVDRCGPWDLVFFTGDLVQQGATEEFNRLESDILPDLMRKLDEIQTNQPRLFVVPGNHDLVRPTPNRAAVHYLLKPDRFHEIADDVFDNGCSEYYQVIEQAFSNYMTWWQKRIANTQLEVQHGLLPGDFSSTVKIANHDIGIVGLNTSFLQLAGGDYRAKLVWDLRQLNAVCNGDAPERLRQHDYCFLLTHQGPKWLNPRSRDEVMNEINPPGRFAVHLYGHEHELEIESRSLSGGPLQIVWQGPSLFGLEKYGEPPQLDRRHGYSSGRLDFATNDATIRIWPRRAVSSRGTGWRFVPDHEGCLLNEDDSGSRPQRVRSKRIQEERLSEERQEMTLDEAQGNFGNLLDKVGKAESIEIRHIGLDMAQAQDRLIVMLRNNLRAKITTVQLLVITASLRKFPKNVQPHVKEWTSQVTHAVSHIKQRLEDNLNSVYKGRGQFLSIDIKSYAEFPSIHGFSLYRKHRRFATYFSFCRWTEDGKKLEWGDAHYRKVPEQPVDRSSEDMVAIFEGAFSHLWNDGTAMTTIEIGEPAAQDNPGGTAN
jgi:predicted MPP superfamily phosphohydrolase